MSKNNNNKRWIFFDNLKSRTPEKLDVSLVFLKTKDANLSFWSLLQSTWLVFLIWNLPKEKYSGIQIFLYLTSNYNFKLHLYLYNLERLIRNVFKWRHTLKWEWVKHFFDIITWAKVHKRLVGYGYLTSFMLWATPQCK